MKQEIKDLDFGLMGVSVYRRVLIIKLIGGYSVLNKKCKTQEEVDKVIDDSLNILENSIITS